MSHAKTKTNAERQADLKARRIAEGLVSLKNVWVHPDDVPEMREHATKLARRREKMANRERPNVLVTGRGTHDPERDTAVRAPVDL